MPIAEGVIVGWPSTETSIPEGWTRVADLDGRYLKGVPNANTDPGATGGAASHTHTSPSHNHGMSHTHASRTSGSHSPANTRLGSSPNATVAGVHTHTTGTSGAASPSNSSGIAVSLGTNANDPPRRLNVIWIESDGTPDAIPQGAVAFGDEVPPGWQPRDNTSGRYLRGANTGSNGGTGTIVSDAHSHSGSHLHDTGHSHSGTSSGPSATTTVRNDSQTFDFARSNHTHALTWVSTNLGSVANSAQTGDTEYEPPHRKCAIIESGGGLLYQGIIAVWLRPLSQIPPGWVLCDGTNGTPNLLGRFVKGAASSLSDVGEAGGTVGHSHGSGPTHTHTTSSHTHTVSFGLVTTATTASNFVGTNSPVGTGSAHSGDHSHTSASSSVSLGNATISGSSTSDTQPPYREVAYIQFQGSPVRVQIGGQLESTLPRIRVGGVWADGALRARVNGQWEA